MNPFGAVYQEPDRIIIHAMAEWFRDEGRIISAADMLHKLGLSAHVLIAPNGQATRLREDKQGAYHAKNHNTHTLGLEFLVPGIHDYESFLQAIKQPYLTREAYAYGLAQVKQWAGLYPIKSIERHSDIDPDRKQDPGEGFPWQSFMEDLAA